MVEVHVSARSLGPFVDLVGDARKSLHAGVADKLRVALGDATIWNVNSTAAGGGVAEMLRPLLRYVRGMGVRTGWLVIDGPPSFFTITKRLHNALHDARGDGSPLGPVQAQHYEEVLAQNLIELRRYVRRGDIVILHDPQTAGLVPGLLEAGARVIWRCHIGHEERGTEVDAGWAFLRKYVEQAPLAVFSRHAYAPRWLPEKRAVTLPPNIDPFSTKNQWLPEVSVRAILDCADLVEIVGRCERAVFVRDDGEPGEVKRKAEVIREDDYKPPWETPLVVQVSRWDRMKDHIGVMHGFARMLSDEPQLEAGLVLAGPSLGGVADDPEGPEVLAEIEHAWRTLPPRARARVQIAQLPMDDIDENAAIVNALQRHAAIIVQKSLREGFGLTVTEAMWKRRPIVASAVGGIKDQIRDGVHGLLVCDPTDEEETASALRRILEDRALGERLADAAHARVLESYLTIGSLERWANLMRLVVEGHSRAA